MRSFCIINALLFVTTVLSNGQTFPPSGGTGGSSDASSLTSGTLNSARLPATTVQTGQSNTYSTGTQDFSAATHTLPAVKGLAATKPATCTTGEEYFATDASAGQNKYLCTASNTWTQQSGGSGGISASGTPSINQQAVWTDSTHVKGVSAGVFNVRTIYGAVPDGSTNNATAIASAFTASNAVTTGAPTVYFDCDTSSTTCQYNYGGSGTSPINPTIPSTIQCAPGVMLNYTGTAHAVDIGPAGGTSYPNQYEYRVQGCTFTGGASWTQGIYVQPNINVLRIQDNIFHNFGPTTPTGWMIYYAGYVSESFITGNYFKEHDGHPRNVMSLIGGNPAPTNEAFVTDNDIGCDSGATDGPCVVSPIGAAIEMSNQGMIAHNMIQAHDPLVIMHGTNVDIVDNNFETNTASPYPPISYGYNDGTNESVTCRHIEGNNFFTPVASGVPIIGPTPSTGTFSALSYCAITMNSFSNSPGSGAAYVNFQNGGNNVWQLNRSKSGGVSDYIWLSNSTAAMSGITSTNQRWVPVYQHAIAGVGVSGNLVGFDADHNLGAAGIRSVAAAITCADSSGSGTAQSCTTTPDRWTYTSYTAGDTILYKTTTTNTGALTLNINGISAVGVRKNAGISTLSAGDLKSGIYYALTYDGTYWEMPSYATVVPASCTGLPSGALFNSSGTASFCP
jgi:hypothetical protein